MTAILFRSQCVKINILKFSATLPWLKWEWFSARMHYLQCVCNGDTAVLHQAIDIMSPAPVNSMFTQWKPVTKFSLRLIKHLCRAHEYDKSQLSMKTYNRIWLKTKFKERKCLRKSPLPVMIEFLLGTENFRPCKSKTVHITYEIQQQYTWINFNPSMDK